MQSSTTAAESGEQKTWKDRTCARDKATRFTPLHVQQKVCGTCDKCVAAKQAAPSSKGKPAATKGNGSKPANGNGRRVQPVPTAHAIVEAKGTPLPPARDAALRSARELLEGIGYKVTELTTPAGPRLLVA